MGENAGRASAMQFAQVVFAFGYEIVIFRETPDVLSIIGALLTVSSVLGIVLRQIHKMRKVSSPTTTQPSEMEDT
eukprot:NODE_3942_length_369_cov_408.500000_g3364_i0.p2 GENE.NODE_3942_length_369_cov_408.500000_g3364_i0~~NODE_3942_length_369_cov_408.500000_g3364_i0.p2  ORF type:complete len:85 (-),score=22.97 NODE_3942_length_369_cov_408.500000_g3364_i0:114-338(-)